MEKEVSIAADAISFPGTLALPEKVRNLFLFGYDRGNIASAPGPRYCRSLTESCHLIRLLDLLTQVGGLNSQ
jgi:hypothetical protein